MKNINENYNRIKIVVETYQRNPRYDHINFQVIKSSSTNSVFLKLISELHDHLSKRTIRYSDHPTTTRVREGKSIRKKITKEEIYQNIYGMVVSIERERVRVLLG